MPSPLGHALGGFIAGWLVGPEDAGEKPPERDGASHRFRVPPRAIAFAALGVAADLDLLVGRHSQFTHSIGAVLIVLGIAVLLVRPRRRDWVILSLAAAAAYASHPLLDWLAEDTTPPRGITALWPFSRDYFLSHADIFLGISRRPWLPGAAWHDLLAIAREVLFLAPLAIAAWWVRRGRTARLQNLRARAGRGVQPLPGDEGLSPGGESPAAE